MPVEFAKKLQPIFNPARYKVIYGGRGGGRSWGVARYLLIEGANKRLRILCTREVQKSIRDSVHRLLTDQIEALGLGGFYTVLDNEIRGANGTLFVFSGLSSQTAESIKSFESINVCWCEEAQNISKRSWGILIPTIRAPGSEIIVTFNPELDSDDTYDRFVVNTPPNAWLCELSYKDNPWFPDVLEQERQHCLLTNAEDYPNIWEGQCKTAVSGAIYAKEVAESIRAGRICNVPYDPTLRVHAIWDLGWNDAMTIIMAQRVRSEVRVIDYIEESHQTLDWYAAQLKGRNYNWGYDFLPHDGMHKDFKTGKSTEDLLKSFGRKVKQTPNIGVENGIKSARMMFPSVYIDKSKCARLVECLKRYRRSINQATNEPGSPVHDEFSHGGDGWRYLSLNVDEMTNEMDEFLNLPSVGVMYPASAAGY